MHSNISDLNVYLCIYLQTVAQQKGADKNTATSTVFKKANRKKTAKTPPKKTPTKKEAKPRAKKPTAAKSETK